MDEYQSMVGFRTNWFVCPLPLGCDTYGNCEYQCPMCYCRKLDNHTWKKPFRPGSLENFKKAFKPYMDSGIALKIGSKSDPYPKVESSKKVTRDVLKYLNDINYPFLVNTRGTGYLRDLDYIDHLFVGIPILPQEKAIFFEGDKLPSITERWFAAKTASLNGIEVVVNSEPLFPFNGEQLNNFLECCLEAEVKAINFYHFNFDHYNIQKLLDNNLTTEILTMLSEFYEYDLYEWAGRKLIREAKKCDIGIGAPDWVNFPWDTTTTTCCGFNFDQREKLTAIEFCRIIKEKGKITWKDVEGCISEFDKKKGHDKYIESLWGKPNNKLYFLDDIPEVTYDPEDDSYKVKESWW